MVLLALEALVEHIRSRDRRPALVNLGLGRAHRAKKVSANGWSLMLAEAKPKPVNAHEPIRSGNLFPKLFGIER